MVSIKKNSKIINILGDSWARLTVTVWNCPGIDRVRGLMSVHELPSNECSKSILKYCSVKWSSQTIFRLKRSTLWPVSMNHRYNSVKPFNGQLAFRREFRGICYLEDLVPIWCTFSSFVYTSIYLTFRHKSIRKSENVVSIPLIACCV